MNKPVRHRNAEAMLTELLFRVSPRMDARAIARRMAERCGSLAPCLEAHPSELRHRDGLNENTALLLAMLPQLARYEMTERATAPGCDLTRYAGCAQLLQARCIGLHHERMQLLCLDECGALRFFGPVTDGTLDETPFYPRSILERALCCAARYLVLCHNHPSGTAYASYADVQATRSLLQAFEGLGLILLDHIIVADGRTVSMRLDSLGEAEFLRQAPEDELLIRWFR